MAKNHHLPPKVQSGQSLKGLIKLCNTDLIFLPLKVGGYSIHSVVYSGHEETD